GYFGAEGLFYSPKGTLFGIGSKPTASENYPYALWELSTGKEMPALEGTDFSVKQVAFSPDGKLMAVFGTRLISNPPGYRVKVFEAATTKELFEVPANIYGPRFVAFLPDNKTVIVPGSKGVLKYWDVATKKERGQSPAIDGYTFALALNGAA